MEAAASRTPLKKLSGHDSVALIFNSDPEPLSWLPKIRELYPREQLTAFVPHGVTVAAPCEVINYTADPFKDDLRFKLVINFTGHPFKCRTAFNTFNFKHPKELIEHARPSLLP